MGDSIVGLLSGINYYVTGRDIVIEILNIYLTKKPLLN